jgi:hypothetical protein
VSIPWTLYLAFRSLVTRMIQWQHGTYSLPGNGSIILEPIAVDGRQLLSSPCTYDTAVYTRFDQPELIKQYERIIDDFHNIPRLNLFRFDGEREQPMYLAYKPPQMLPTETLNPTATAGAGAAQSTSNKFKRDMERDAERTAHRQWHQKMIKGEKFEHESRWDKDRFWWAGFGFIAVGSVMYMLPTKL